MKTDYAATRPLGSEPAPVTKVLVADDSFFVQKTMREWLEKEGDIKVVATASDGVEAVRKVMSERPDLVFLDVRMPRLDGLEALRQIMRSYPTPTLVYCEHEKTEARDIRLREKAMELGALEVIFKPEGDEILNDSAVLGENLRQRARTLSKIKVVRLLGGRDETTGGLLTPPPAEILREMAKVSRSSTAAMVNIAMRSDAEVQMRGAERRVVLIGASTGGPDALRVVLSRIPRDFPTPIVIAQHMPRGFTHEFASQLARTCLLPVKEADETDVIRPGNVYVAPGNHNIEFRGQSGFTITAMPGNQRHTPSIDLLFKSGAARFKDGVVGVVLTGMGNDGQAGVRTIKAVGGAILAQDEATSSIWGMPKMAIDTGCVDVVAPLQDIAQWVVHYSLGRGTPRRKLAAGSTERTSPSPS